MSIIKVQDILQVNGQVQLILYIDDIIVCCTNDKLEASLEVEDGWHSIRFECVDDLFSNLVFDKENSIQFTRVTINGKWAWPIDAGNQTFTPPVPFHTLQGHCYDGGNGYIARDNKLFLESCITMYVKINNNEVVDHYYDRGDHSNVDAYPSDAWLFDDRNPESLEKFSLVWSDIYQAYVHRLIFEDHFIVKHDPTDTSTYGSKWRGVYLEATPRALDESANRAFVLENLRELRNGKAKALDIRVADTYKKSLSDRIDEIYQENVPNKNSPLYGIMFFDYAVTNTDSPVIAESGKEVVADFWQIPHVFSKYTYNTLPPEFLAFVLKIV